HATVTLRTHDGSDKPFDGIISEARWMGAGENGHRYRLTLKPWFWLASLRRNQRIFHNKTVVDILTELLGAYASAGKMETRLTLDYPELEYTVQYRESDMDFAARLMERHGISYHFEQDSGSHLMVLTDIVESHATIGERPFKPYDGHHQEEIEHFWEWRPARRITTGAVRLTDYNFKTPTAAMETNSSSSSRYAQGQIESFDWPGDYLDQSRGDVVARLRSEGETGQDRRFEAQGDIPALGAGLRVTLGGEPLPGTGEDYLCLVAHHSYTSDNYGSGGEEGDGYAYTGRYVLLPADAPLVPELKTARADVKGPQTAVVVGDGEIDCDEYGRILVQFHWDLDAAYSMRCRVSQSWAGNGWGGMVIPRIGMEVVVEFLDGDPDKPLVTGCVYNGKNAVPYDLPEHKTRSTFQTDTHEGEGFNELRFEDKKGEEEVFLHAQKDMNVGINNNFKALIKGFFHRHIRRNFTSLVQGHKADHAEKSSSITTRGPMFIGTGTTSPINTINDGFFSKGGSSDFDHESLFWSRDALKTPDPEALTIASGGDASFFSDGDMSLQSDRSFNISANGSLNTITQQQMNSSSRGDTMTYSGNRYMIGAEGAIILQCGMSKLTMRHDGEINMTGSLIKINGTKICLN
uniref:type VI secretion system Vgr family protein n=2 Tax=Celeribacter ethanolicus TaxID=1758178 RepID=UPI00082DD5CB